ncbi:MAG: hypothetical protein ACF8PN_12305 [Phycisphaerales bacterium]
MGGRRWMKLALAVTVLGSGGLFGCQKPLFPKSADRTQYDQYDRLRGQYVPPTKEDFYGRSEPALRERLRRK